MPSDPPTMPVAIGHSFYTMPYQYNLASYATELSHYRYMNRLLKEYNSGGKKWILIFFTTSEYCPYPAMQVQCVALMHPSPLLINHPWYLCCTVSVLAWSDFRFQWSTNVQNAWLSHGMYRYFWTYSYTTHQRKALDMCCIESSMSTYLEQQLAAHNLAFYSEVAKWQYMVILSMRMN